MGSPAKTCVECQTPAHSTNYGAVTCDACRVFFRRASTNSTFKNFRCYDGSHCSIDEVNRKWSCAFSRFQKCLKMGMVLDAFHNGRNGSYYQKQRRTETCEERPSRHNKELVTAYCSKTPTSYPRCFVPRISDLSNHYSMMELFDLDSLWSKYSYSFHYIPVNEEAETDLTPYTYDGFFSIVSAIGKRFLFFAESVPDFHEFTINDRSILFLSAISELCMVNSCLVFNKDENMWFSPFAHKSKFYENLPCMKSGAMIEFFGPDLYRKKLKIILDVQKCQPDEITIMLMFCILLFTPTRAGLRDVKLAQRKQNYFATLLQKYLLWGCGEVNGRRVYDTLVSKLKDFRRTGPLVFQKLHGPMLQQPKYNFLSEVFPGML